MMMMMMMCRRAVGTAEQRSLLLHPLWQQTRQGQSTHYKHQLPSRPRGQALGTSPNAFLLHAARPTTDQAGASRHPVPLPPFPSSRPSSSSFVAPETRKHLSAFWTNRIWLRNYRTRSLPSNGQRTKAHLTQPTHVLTLASPPSFITGTVSLPRRVELELAKRQKTKRKRAGPLV